jgi:cell division protein FtsI (penicillin-binding protein 3)
MLRLGAVRLSFALGVLLILGRAAQVQLVNGSEHAAAATAQRTERTRIQAPRGGIYDRNGVSLALTQPVFEVGVAPNELRDMQRDVALIADRLDLPTTIVQRAMRRRYAYFRGPFSSAQVRDLRQVRGVHLTASLRRFYPRPNLARPLIGLPAADGRPASGLERTFDDVLTGTDGSAVVLRDRAGIAYAAPSGLDEFPIPGNDLYLTIDVELQEIVEQALADAIEALPAAGGDVVVLAPRTGEILAVASQRRDGPTAAAFLSAFEPGSTAKLFAAAALLAESIAVPTERVFVEGGRYEFDGRVIEDDHPADWLSFQEVIERSSNIGMVKLASRLEPERQYEMLRAFGFGTPTGVEFPVESPGILRLPHRWSGTSAASLAMGYEVAVSPIQLAQAYAAIANDGVLVQPTLVREIRTTDGTLVRRHGPTPVRRAIRPDVARTLKSMLRGVVYRGGTGEAAALSTYEVAGKTGTARRAGPGGYVRGSYIASFASLFPADDPQLVMVVKLDDPRLGYASTSAAPVTRAVLEQLLASRTSVLDRGALGKLNPVLARSPTAEPDVPGPRFVTNWPAAQRTSPTDSMVIVPDVSGLSVRRAAERLHRAGLRAGAERPGAVRATDPVAGDTVPRGSVIQLRLAEGSHRR